MTLRRIALLCALLLLPSAALAQDPKQALNEQLYEAVRKGDLAAVKSLLDKGADANAKFRYGATVLFKAAERGHAEIAKLLIERGVDVNVRDTFYQATAMYWALDKGHVGVVRAILEKDPSSVDDVLMNGARGGNVEMLRVALDRGGAKPETLTTALVAATKENKADIIEMLKKAGAQPPPEVDAATLQTYVGKYKAEQGLEVTFSVKEGQLYGTATGQPTLTFISVDKTTFRPMEFDGLTITFNVEGDKVTGFTFKQGSTTMLLKKIE